jgi:hypothetical protein
VILVEAIVIGTVSYRLWRLLALDEITAPVRDRLLSRSAWLDSMWTCPWCLGTWVTIGVGLAAYFTGLTETSPWLAIPASSVVVGLLGRWDS